MTLEELAEAAISYSDNPAMNLIMKKFGGPKFVTDFVHSIGNKTFNVEHYEPDLNSIANDLGIMWSPTCKPIVIAIYTVQNKQNTKSRDDIVASATNIVLDEFFKK